MDTQIRTTGVLGPLLKQLRKAKGLSQTELGNLIGLSQERISAIEAAPEKVTFDNLLTVMMALDAHFSIGHAGIGNKTHGKQHADGDW